MQSFVTSLLMPPITERRKGGHVWQHGVPGAGKEGVAHASSQRALALGALRAGRCVGTGPEAYMINLAKETYIYSKPADHLPGVAGPYGGAAMHQFALVCVLRWPVPDNDTAHSRKVASTVSIHVGS